MSYIKMNSATQSKPFYDVYTLVYMMNEFNLRMSKEDVFLLTKKIWELNDNEIKLALKNIFG